jgi:hypothetical protein
MVITVYMIDLILLEGYCRQIKQTYHSPCANYYNGIIDKSNIPIIVTVLTIRTGLQYPSNSSYREYSMAIWFVYNTVLIDSTVTIKVITKLPNSEQSYKGKVKAHNYITGLFDLLEQYYTQIRHTYVSPCVNY